MDIQSLRYFIALAERGNFLAASEDCSISQASMSKHVRKLEAEAGGVVLFDRSHRPVVLTPAGEEYLRFARRIVESYELLCRSMEKYRQHVKQEFRIGVLPVIRRLGVSRIITSFRQQEPDVNLSIIDRPTGDLLDMLEHDRLDAAILLDSPHGSIPDTVSRYFLKRLELMAVMRRDHPLSRNRILRYGDIANEGILLLDSSTALYSICTSAFEGSGFVPASITTCRNIETLLDLAASGYGVAFCSKDLLATYSDLDVVAVPLADPIVYDLVLAIPNRVSTNPLQERFVLLGLTERLEF